VTQPAPLVGSTIVARGRVAGDWSTDRARARPGEEEVARILQRHPLVSGLDDRSASKHTPDFEFTLDGRPVGLEMKEQRVPCNREIAAVWPDVPACDLLILDELSLRRLVWADGLGYLALHDVPGRRWHLFGPWELWLAPRRRYERPGDKGAGPFLKGKVLLDARTSAETTPQFDVDVLIAVVRRSRRALTQVEAVDIKGHGPLPTVPSVDRSTIVKTPGRPPAPGPSAMRPPESTPGAVVAADWCGLSKELVRALRERWNWQQLTAVQQAAIPAILGQQSTLVLGPTAGGKTEAAMLPLIDRWQLEGWREDQPSILCLSPRKALLDDQLDRWQRGTALVRASAFAWHGDVASDEKRAFRADPADVLLTTPESLEQLLSDPQDRRRLIGLRAVVIDEAHAFVGNPRGAQVASLLERLEAIAHQDIQRIALSATVPDRDAVVAWLRGRSLREAGAVDGGRATIGEVVTIRSHEDLDQAVSTITAEQQGRRCLVFAGSRRRVEELALRLGVPAHHSSVSGKRRADALGALRSGAIDLLVTSSSLEMGIDVGDLDLVVHDGPPPGPSSYLQRLGRAGRRTGHRAITFLVGSPDDLLLVLANLLRARREDLDPVDPTRGARLVLGQQAVLLTMQQSISSRAELYETLRFSPVFAGLQSEIEATIDHLVRSRYLATQGGVVALGAEGQRRYGGRVRELLATFTGASSVGVVDELGREVAEIDWSLVEAVDAPARRTGLVLGGTSWKVLAVHASPKKVVVAPGGAGTARGWRGATMPVSRATWEAAREVLGSTDVPSDSDARADAWLDSLRRAWKSRLDSPLGVDAEGVVAHTFAGDDVHQAVLHALGIDGRAEGPTLRIFSTPAEVRSRAAKCVANLDSVLDREAARLSDLMPITYRELSAPSVILAEARQFEVDALGTEAVLTLLATWRS